MGKGKGIIMLITLCNHLNLIYQSEIKYVFIELFLLIKVP